MSSSGTASKVKLSSLFTNPQRPTSSNSKTSSKLSSLFIKNQGTPTSSNPTTSSENLISKVPIQTQLEKFLETNCKSGDVTINEALHYFEHMIQMQPTPPIWSFNRLFGGLAKIGLLPNFITLNILLNCFCNVTRARDGFVVMGSLLRRGYRPSTVTYTALLKGLCMEDRIDEATRLFKTMIKLGCQPTVVTFGTLVNGLCRTGNTNVALRSVADPRWDNRGRTTPWKVGKMA
ncbi:unnamed protein product [Prunus armeniaca]|uniref:Pentacotripeptide-repeat region of PRORP domain-containing protein n=1 Tax=Prunus armeniaca TaxID=36596 RepID=A0A6J5Y6Y5_PRUAR|nr:unnamed protein product [Prunus armeniaca]